MVWKECLEPWLLAHCRSHGFGRGWIGVGMMSELDVRHVIAIEVSECIGWFLWPDLEIQKLTLAIQSRLIVLSSPAQARQQQQQQQRRSGANKHALHARRRARPTVQHTRASTRPVRPEHVRAHGASVPAIVARMTRVSKLRLECRMTERQSISFIQLPSRLKTQPGHWSPRRTVGWEVV